MINRNLTVVLLIAVAAMIGACGSGDPQRMIIKAQEYRQKADYKGAIIELKNVLQKDGSNAEARYLLGVTYYDTRQYRLAEQELRRALELSYERSKVMPTFARALLMSGDFKKLIDQVPMEGHASNATQADILTLRARALIGLGRSDQARELLNFAMVKQPEFAGALVELARLAAGENKLTDSASLIERAIASDSKHVDAWLVKADLLRLQADYVGALAINQKILEIDANNTSASLNIASIYVIDNKLDMARKVVSQVRSRDPTDIRARHMQALVEFQARDYRAANDSVLQLLKLVPNHLPGILLAGAIAIEQGSYAQAQTHLGIVLEKSPGNLYARKLMVLTLMRSGQVQRAVEIVVLGLRQAPEDSQLISLAGELYLQTGEFGKAVEYFDKAAKLDPKDAMARSMLGISRMASGDTGRAFVDLESAVTIDSSKYQTDLVLVVSYLRQGNYDQALKSMESLEKKQPNNPVTHNLKGVIYLGKDDVLGARRSFERAVELQPTFLVAAKNLALLDLRDKNPKVARSRLEAILAKDKENVPALVALAELGPMLGSSQKERVDWLDRALKASPQSLQPLLMLANLYFQVEDPRKALEVLQQAYSRSPDNPQILDMLGSAQLRAGQREQALATFRKLATLQPKSAEVLYRLASSQVVAGEHSAAEDSLKHALSLQPDFADAYTALVSMQLRTKRYSEATALALQLQKQNPKSPLGLLLEGDVLMAEKKFVRALKVYETVHGLSKNSASLAKLHGAYVAAGKEAEGDAQLAKWLKEKPDDIPATLYAAESALKRGLHKEAILQYERLLQKQPESVMVLNNLSWAYLRAKDVRALETAERAYKLVPDNSTIADTYGVQLIEAGDFRRGIEVLEKAAKASPNIVEIRFHIAKGWMKAGEKAKARAELERVLATNERFAFHAEAQDMLKQLRRE